MCHRRWADEEVVVDVENDVKLKMVPLVGRGQSKAWRNVRSGRTRQEEGRRWWAGKIKFIQMGATETQGWVTTLKRGAVD